MARELNIRAMIWSFGEFEDQRASHVLMEWGGTLRFRDAESAIQNFLGECAKAREYKQNECCTATRARNPRARACEECGTVFSETARPIGLEDYLSCLHLASADNFPEAAYPYDSGCKSAVELRLGNWMFFRPFPCSVCDVVLVRPTFRASEFAFSVLQVGKCRGRGALYYPTGLP